MSASASTKTFGFKLGAEPRKVLVLGGLVLVAIAVYFLNSGNDTGTVQAPTHSAVGTAPNGGVQPGARVRVRRRLQRNNEKNTLRMEEVTLEASRGDIDPTLRLDLLQRLKSVKFTGGNRNLFELGAVAPQQLASAKPVTIMPGPIQRPGAPVAGGPPVGPAAPPPIPLKFYGFSAPSVAGGVRRGFFLDQDNVIVANQGDTIMGRFRIVNLQAMSAEVEDVVTKNRQTLPIVPESAPSAM